jgi:hypothetical protein
VFTPALAKHSKSFSLIDCISVGVDRMQRNFEPIRKQVAAWQRSELTDGTAKVVIYEAFVEGRLEAPKHLARTVHDLYFEPKYEEFRSGRSGVSPTHSHRHSRNWSRSHSSRLRPTWVNSSLSPFLLFTRRLQTVCYPHFLFVSSAWTLDAQPIVKPASESQEQQWSPISTPS